MSTVTSSTELSDFHQLVGFDGVYLCDVNELTVALAELLYGLGLPVRGFVRPEGPAGRLTSMDVGIENPASLSEKVAGRRTALIHSQRLVSSPDAWPPVIEELGACTRFDPWPLMKPFTEVDDWGYMVPAFQYFGNSEKGVLFDVGANNGGASQLAVGLFNAVFAFEPSPLQREKFNHRFAGQPMRTQITLLPYALGREDQRGIQTFYHELSEGGGGSSLLKESSDRNSAGFAVEEIQVEVKTLKDACTELGVVPTFLKLDVEGSEPDVILGSKEIIAEHKPAILFECWRHSWGEGVRDLVLFLKQQGYTVKCSYIGGDMWDVFEFGAPLNYVTNALCAPPHLEFPPLL